METGFGLWYCTAWTWEVRSQHTADTPLLVCFYLGKDVYTLLLPKGAQTESLCRHDLMIFSFLSLGLSL